MAVSPTSRFLHAALRSPPLPISSYGIDQHEGSVALCARYEGGAMPNWG